MFRTNAAADELADLMRRELFKDDANKSLSVEANIELAAFKMAHAANIFDELGMSKEAEVITLMLESLNV